MAKLLVPLFEPGFMDLSGDVQVTKIINAQAQRCPVQEKPDKHSYNIKKLLVQHMMNGDSVEEFGRVTQNTFGIGRHEMQV